MTLQDLIKQHLRAKQLSRVDLARQMGYANLSKALRRLAAFEHGDWGLALRNKQALANALDVPVSTIEDAAENTRQAIIEAEHQAYIAAFEPHAVLLTSRAIPSPIFAAAMSGSHKQLVVSLPDHLSPVEWPAFVAETCPDGIPAFGTVDGFVINYRPDYAVTFDRQGNPTASRGEAVRTGEAFLLKS